MWCYLFIGCFDWKICVFQQTVVRVYYILNLKDIWITREEIGSVNKLRKNLIKTIGEKCNCFPIQLITCEENRLKTGLQTKKIPKRENLIQKF